MAREQGIYFLIIFYIKWDKMFHLVCLFVLKCLILFPGRLQMLFPSDRLIHLMRIWFIVVTCNSLQAPLRPPSRSMLSAWQYTDCCSEKPIAGYWRERKKKKQPRWCLQDAIHYLLSQSFGKLKAWGFKKETSLLSLDEYDQRKEEHKNTLIFSK